jgi:electron transfer flavoprotein alpha subunit
MSTVLVIAEHRLGELRPVTLELLTVAQQLKQQGMERTEVLVLGASAERIASGLGFAGIDEILAVPTSSDVFESDTYAHAVSSLIAERLPRIVLIAHSVDGISYAPAVAASGGHGFATDVLEVRFDAGEFIAIRAAYREKLRMELDFPGKDTVVLTIRAGGVAPAVDRAAVTVTAVKLAAVTTRSRHHGFLEPEASAGVDIGSAEFILAVGRGIGDQSMVGEIGELARAMGATLACSRPIVDAGWLSKSHQVGQSGRTATNCRLYLAMGISGAVQHLAGMKHVENIIAVNKDPEAAIFGVARYGVVADAAEIAEELKNYFS